ncbi:MAG: polysaccharide biosynthesis C-terminal domain-containing protein, partial [Flammeovirgaceae bacterium]
IISLSKYYRFTVITIIILAIISIALNLFLIPIYGMIGAAFASLISILIFNIVKHIFIKIKMNISPFSMNSFKVILIGIVLFTFDNYLMPTLDNNFISILFKSAVISAIYISVIYLLKISPKLNGMIKSFFKN